MSERKCSFCRLKIDFSEIPVNMDGKQYHFFCYQLKKFVRHHAEKVKDLAQEVIDFKKGGH